MTWQTQTLGEICDEGGGEVRTGPFGSQLHESDYSELGTPVVMPKDIIEGRVSERTVARIADEHVDRLAQHQLRTGDIVYGRRGDIGRQALITPRESGWLCGTGCLRITPGRAKVDSTYLHYYLRDAGVIEGIAQQAIGATMPNLNTAILRGIQVRFPPAREQRRIASILSGYDDLIENNTRRNAILEEMARRIYEEWFVRFRFPGHEGLRMVETELGLMPEGWNVMALQDIATITMGLSPKGDTYNEASDGTPLINGPVEFGERFMKRVKWTTAPTKLCGEGDLVVCVRGSTTGKYVKRDGVYCLGRGVCAIRGEYQGFVDQVFAQQLPILLGQVGGSTFPSWTGPQLKLHPVLVPTRDLLARFETHAAPMRDAVRAYSRQIDNLRATRDLLLPKLISGELDVSAIPESEALAA